MTFLLPCHTCDIQFMKNDYHTGDIRFTNNDTIMLDLDVALTKVM